MNTQPRYNEPLSSQISSNSRCLMGSSTIMMAGVYNGKLWIEIQYLVDLLKLQEVQSSCYAAV